ncbi:MAG: cyclic nucleotide-binding domain-containing protein [Gammaproteobacteria bacterium]|nr:cyclic nucleotide-binding domain-containing protein [Gammaproteobacteria bacterium]
MAVDFSILQKFVPLQGLTHENLRDLSTKASVEELKRDKTLFRRNQSDSISYYLIEGSVFLLYENGKELLISADSPEAKHPLDNNQPRSASALAKSDIKYLKVDNNLLDMLLTWDQSASYAVSEIKADDGDDDEGDWMSSMLKLELFRRIPPSNIQKIFMRMESESYSQGDVVIAQGDEGDYYYFIKKGNCEVTVRGKSGKDIRLAELHAGMGFGEEALVSKSVRNATVTMTSEGSLMRLAKNDFEELLRTPILKNVDLEEMKRLVREERAVLIDVRLESEFNHSNLKGSLNIPLFMLRIKMQQFDKTKKYILLCDTGRRSSAATFLLNERGFEAFYLENGLKGLAAAKKA